MSNLHEKILGKIVALTKEIKLQEPKNEEAYISKFFPGNSLLGGIGLRWWCTRKAFSICQDIASMSISCYPEYQPVDKEAFTELVMNTFQDNALNEQLFYGDAIFLSKAKRLFDVRAKDNVKEFSEAVWQEVKVAFDYSVCNWMVLYPLRRINSESFSLNHDGITLVQSKDETTCQYFLKKYKVPKYLNPFAPNEKKEQNGKREITISTWLVCETKGTDLGARTKSMRLMRKFLGVLFSILRAQIEGVLQKSMADPESWSIQFGLNSEEKPQNPTQAPIGVLLPPLIQDIEVPSEILSKVLHWYERSLSDNYSLHRATKASHFINYAMIASDLEQFIHFFIALDALFGVRGKVEETIIKGVSENLPNGSWNDRIKKLFDLRSELLHGGSSYIEEWRGFDQYQTHFKSHPARDVEFAAMTCLRNYFVS